jgi:hypothetical protein
MRSQNDSLAAIKCRRTRISHAYGGERGGWYCRDPLLANIGEEPRLRQIPGFDRERTSAMADPIAWRSVHEVHAAQKGLETRVGAQVPHMLFLLPL